MSYGEPDAPANCNNARGDEIASAGGQRIVAAFRPSYGGYTDPLGGSFPDAQQSISVASLPATRRHRTAAAAHGRVSKRTVAVGSYKQVAEIAGAPSFLPLTPER